MGVVKHLVIGYCSVQILNESSEVYFSLSPLTFQAHVHGLSEKRAQRLAELDLRARQREEGEKVGSGRGHGSDSPLERSIPSVPTMDQLPYLTIQ